jgi:hypothetical protein
LVANLEGEELGIAQGPEVVEPEDLLTPNEVAPKEVKTKPEYVCELCGKVYKGIIGKANLGNHIKYKHSGEVLEKQRKALPKTKAAIKAVEDAKKTRHDTADTISLVVTGAAQFAAKTGMLPLANTLLFEAPAAGVAIDRAVAGTFVDKKVLQPLAGGAEAWGAVGAIVSLPVMVHLVSLHPNLAVALEGQMRSAAEEILILSVPTMKKKAVKNAKLIEALVELGKLSPEIAADPDPVGSLISSFFPKDE